MGGMAWSAAPVERTEKLVGTDSIMTAVAKLSGGNFGAMSVCTQLFARGAEIDPKGIPGFGPLLLLDSLHIYGSRIWLLYKDICGEDVVMTLACLRGWQLGIINQRDLIKAIDNAEGGNRAHNLDLPAILAAVKEQLGDFGNAPVPQSTPQPEPQPLPLLCGLAEAPSTAEAEQPQPSPGLEIDRVINLD